MTETRTFRILDVSSNMENNEQQYVEIGSNFYLGTKDGMKYKLIKTSGNKFRLEEVLSDSSVNFSDSNGSLETSTNSKSLNASNIQSSKPICGTKEIKIITVKSEPSPCKGQGDEFGNIVLTPPNVISDFKENNYTAIKNEKLRETPDGSMKSDSALTYTTLYPKQKNEQQSTYYLTPRSACSKYMPTFPSPIPIPPARHPRKPRVSFTPDKPPYTPVPRARRGAPRMRRPKSPVYRYTPQIMHSTPSNLTDVNYSSESGTSSGSLSGSSLSKSNSSIEYPRVPYNTPTSSDISSGDQKVFSLEWVPYIENCVGLTPRECHNEKERHRRRRIKNACQDMRDCMRWIPEKTDNATAFEEVTRYLTYVRYIKGCEFDQEFLDSVGYCF